MSNQKIQITYDNNIAHTFKVIDHYTDYLNVIKPAEDRLFEIECLNKNQQKKHADEVKELEEKLSHYNFRWCTNQSPIYNSVETQVLSLHKNQGGDHPVKSKFI